MTKAELIEEVSRFTNMTGLDSALVVEAIFDSIVYSLRDVDKAEMRRFGNLDSSRKRLRLTMAAKVAHFKADSLPRAGRTSPHRKLFLDEASGKIGYGLCYGEQSYNGRPLQPGNLRRSDWEIPSDPFLPDDGALPAPVSYDYYATPVQDR